MATYSRKKIKDAIRKAIRSNGNKPGNWYVGFTKNHRTGLFVDHNVDEDEDLYLTREARNSLSAAKTVHYFKQNGTMGDNVAGINENTEALSAPDSNFPDPDRTIVYAYESSLRTDP